MDSTKVSHDSETPAIGQQVITACAFIYKKVNNEILLFLPKRAATKKFLPNKFELPGGHIEFGEDLITGLKREIQEEFEVEIDVEKCFYAFTYVNNIKKSHSVEIVFYAKLISPESEIRVHLEDHSEFRWIDKQQYIELIGNDIDDESKAVVEGFDSL